MQECLKAALAANRESANYLKLMAKHIETSPPERSVLHDFLVGECLLRGLGIAKSQEASVAYIRQASRKRVRSCGIHLGNKLRSRKRRAKGLNSGL